METSGFIHYEPIQIAVVLFLNGIPVKHINWFFLPTSEITEEAREVHGLNKTQLLQKNAVLWTKGKSEMIVNFLNEHPDFPIVTHGVKHDYLLVLKPAFEKVENLERLPRDDRWLCTIELS